MRSWVERSKSQAKALCVLGGRGGGKTTNESDKSKSGKVIR